MRATQKLLDQQPSRPVVRSTGTLCVPLPETGEESKLTRIYTLPQTSAVYHQTVPDVPLRTTLASSLWQGAHLSTPVEPS